MTNCCERRANPPASAEISPNPALRLDLLGKTAFSQVRALRSLLSAICLSLASTSVAQTVPGGGGGTSGDSTPTNTTPSPEELAITSTGVDIRTGRFAYLKTDLDAGPLKLERQITNDARGHLQPFSNMSHNFDIFIAERRFSMSNPRPPGEFNSAGNDFQLFVHYGGARKTFEASAGQAGPGHASEAQGFLTVSGDRASSSAIYTFESIDGTRVQFRPIGSGDCSTTYRCAFASKITRPDGEVITLSYDTGGPSGHGARLARVESNFGYAIKLDYGGSGTWHQVSKACIYNAATMSPVASCNVGALQTINYAYAGKLAAVTDAMGALWKYDYPAGKMEFRRPGETVPYLTNTIVSQTNDHLETVEIVTRQVLGDGLIIDYQYDYAPHQSTGSTPYYPVLAGGRMVDNLGRSRTIDFGFPIVPGTGQTAGGSVGFGDVKYQVTAGPERIVDEIGRQWTFDYCDPTAAAIYQGQVNRCLVMPYPLTMTDPAGGRTEYSYDGKRTRNVVETRRKAQSGSGLSDIVTSAVHDCSSMVFCTKPQSTTDAKGQATNYEYSPNHGGILKATYPPDENGVRPQTRYAYAQKYGWKKSGASFVRQSLPVWLLTSHEVCRTSQADANGNCAAGLGDKVVTTYQYEEGSASKGSNLSLIGVAVTADGQTLRTCFEYDEAGRRISETLPRADLATCQ